MSTFVHVIPQPARAGTLPASVGSRLHEVRHISAASWDIESFAEEQIRGLVRQLYLTGSKPSRQVVFTAVDDRTDVSALCRQAAEALSEESCGTACLLDASFQTRNSVVSGPSELRAERGQSQRLRDAAIQISNKLWYMPSDVFLGQQSGGISSTWLRARLAELRLEFDHLLIQAPAASVTNHAALLARLCDGLVLVLEANTTRRAAAQKTKDRLAAAHVRLLGTVLTERTFPIPRAIYERA